MGWRTDEARWSGAKPTAYADRLCRPLMPTDYADRL